MQTSTLFHDAWKVIFGNTFNDFIVICEVSCVSYHTFCLGTGGKSLVFIVNLQYREVLCCRVTIHSVNLGIQR